MQKDKILVSCVDQFWLHWASSLLLNERLMHWLQVRSLWCLPLYESNTICRNGTCSWSTRMSFFEKKARLPSFLGYSFNWVTIGFFSWMIAFTSLEKRSVGKILKVCHGKIRYKKRSSSPLDNARWRDCIFGRGTKEPCTAQVLTCHIFLKPIRLWRRRRRLMRMSAPLQGSSHTPTCRCTKGQASASYLPRPACWITFSMALWTE